MQAFAASGAALDAGDSTGYTALHAAASYEQTEVVAWLLSAGASPAVVDDDGDTPLHVCEGGPAAAALLAGGASLTAPNGAGESAYAVAVAERRGAVVEVLRAAYLARGLDIPEVEAPADDDDDDEDNDDDDIDDEALAAALAAHMAQGGMTEPSPQ